MTAIDMILTATFTGFGVAIGQFMFEQIKKRWAIHKEHAMKFGQRIGSGINKTFINKESV
jgi:hypothetical protein